MPNRTSTGLLLPVILVVGLVAVFGGSKVADLVGSLFSGHDPVIMGEGDAAFMVAANAKPKVTSCAAQKIIQDKQCDGLKIVIFDAAKMPFITRNISLAWGEGKAAVLTKNSAAQNANRSKVCGRNFKKVYPNGSCDEYPFATTQEGGEGARTEEVHKDEQDCQGGTLGTSYRYQNISDGDQFLVIIRHPDKIGPRPWQGEEIEVGQC
jgi:hypothetical protein